MKIANKKPIKILSSILFLLTFSFLHADDTEIFLGGSSLSPDPKVLFLMDNSTSMTNKDGGSQTRMSIAKEILLGIVHDPNNINLDIGVAALSEKYSGGTIIAAINDTNSAGIRGNQPTYSSSGHGSCSPTQSTTTLTQRICNIEATGHTQLEETYWELYLYFKGATPEFGGDSSILTTDPLAMNGSSYFSPIFNDSALLTDISGNGSKSIAEDLSCQTNYIVMMTDGRPYSDDEANSDISTLTGNSCSGSGECMNELAEYLFENDMDADSSNDKQNIVTYTVGFHISSGSDADVLLQDIASDGGGQAFLADNSSGLSTALNTIFSNINNSSTTFSSPSTANSASNDAQSLDYIYTSTFKPENKPKWSGNIKKYRLDQAVTGTDSLGNDILEFKTVDQNDKIVYDDLGNIISIANSGTYDVQSIWSASADTDTVEAGGAGASISNYSSRTIYTNADTDNDANTQDIFTNFDTANTNLDKSQFSAADDTEKDKWINWARGQDTEDEDNDSSTSDTRWVLGDPLHSSPIVINYGKRQNDTDYTGDYSDIRLVFGTNAGFLHLFKDDLGGASNTSTSGHTTGDVVSESWAFIPKELLANLKTLNANADNVNHPYGMDGIIGLYFDDKNQDGNICAKTLDCNGDNILDGDVNADGDTTDSGEGDDKVIIIAGMRRGGAYYYAIDITNPDVPSFLWKYTHSDIQQSWSTPQFGQVKYFDGSGVQIKKVVIFSGGYDTNKDITATLGTDDTYGKGLYMLDLETGSLIWSVVDGTSTSTATALYQSNLDNSIPASPKAIDINNDGILDRIYLADTGGNVWRIDLFNQDVGGDDSAYSTIPPTPPYDPIRYDTDSRLFWSIFKLANLGRGEVSTLANDRHFFNQVDYVQTRDTTSNFDAVLLGSGHRNNPTESSVNNRFYMLKDKHISAYKYKSSACETDTTLQAYDPYCKLNPTALNNSSLSDTTSNPSSSYTTNGWRLDLATTGEKNLSSSVTINGTVIFSTFAPVINTNSPCTPQGGTSYLYAVDLHTSIASIDFDDDDNLEDEEDRKKPILGSGIPETPTVIIPGPDIGDGNGIYLLSGTAPPINIGETSTNVQYWFNQCE